MGNKYFKHDSIRLLKAKTFDEADFAEDHANVHLIIHAEGYYTVAKENLPLSVKNVTLHYIIEINKQADGAYIQSRFPEYIVTTPTDKSSGFSIPGATVTSVIPFWEAYFYEFRNGIKSGPDAEQQQWETLYADLDKHLRAVIESCKKYLQN